MTLWTGFKQLLSTFDDKTGPNEEEENDNTKMKGSPFIYEL